MTKHRAGLLVLSLTFLLATSPPAAGEPAGSSRAAVVNGIVITEAEVDAVIAGKLLPLQQQIFAMRKSALDTLVVRALLADEARQAGISVEELRRRITQAPATVEAAEVERVFAENAAAFGAMSPDEALERVRLDLETQARMRRYRDHISELKQGALVEVLLREPSVRVANDAAIPSMGEEHAPVTIVEFSDFECPYCRGAAGTLKRLVADSEQRVRLVFRNLPSASHPSAFAAARAGVCAAEQKRFWEYHDALFVSGELSQARIDEAVGEAGLDRGTFDACVSADRSRQAVMNDVDEAKRLGINGTPAFIVNGAVVPAGSPPEQLQRIVERELNATRSAAVRP